MDDGIPFPAGNNLPALVPYSEWPRSEWDRPFNHGLFKEREHYLVTVHSFEAGGFEATVRHVDLQKMMDLAMLPRGIRKPPAERDPLGVLRAGNRAKKTLRHCVKTIGATHLLTLTTR